MHAYAAHHSHTKGIVSVKEKGFALKKIEDKKGTELIDAKQEKNPKQLNIFACLTSELFKTAFPSRLTEKRLDWLE